MKKSSKKSVFEGARKKSNDLVIWDGTKDNKMNQFLRLLCMKENDRNKELDQVNRKNRKLMEEKAKESMEVTEFFTKKDFYLLVVIFLFILFLCIAFAFVSLIPGISVTILAAIVIPVEFYPIIRKSLYRIIYNDIGFLVLYGNKVEFECRWEDIQSQSEIYKFAGKFIYFETVKGRVYIYRTHYGVYPFIKRAQDEYRRIHGMGIPILNIKK